MKPTEESTDAHGDFVDEATNVMGGELLSSLTERSRWNDPAAAVPEPEISIVHDEPEPVTTMRPVGPPKPLVVDREYPALGDEEATAMMDEPEPTTVAIRKHRDEAAPPLAAASPLPAPPTRAPLALVPLALAPPIPALPPPAPPSTATPPLAAPSIALPPLAAPTIAPPTPPRIAAAATTTTTPPAPDPMWTTELAPRALPTIRVPPLPAPELDATPESTATRPGSRWLSALAAVALGVAVWTVGLGHHESAAPPAVIAAPAPSVSSVRSCQDTTAPGSPQRARCGSSAR